MKMSRADEQPFDVPFLNAARQTKSEGRQTLTEDVKRGIGGYKP